MEALIMLKYLFWRKSQIGENSDRRSGNDAICMKWRSTVHLPFVFGNFRQERHHAGDDIDDGVTTFTHQQLSVMTGQWVKQRNQRQCRLLYVCWHQLTILRIYVPQVRDIENGRQINMIKLTMWWFCTFYSHLVSSTWNSFKLAFFYARISSGMNTTTYLISRKWRFWEGNGYFGGSMAYGFGDINWK